MTDDVFQRVKVISIHTPHAGSDARSDVPFSVLCISIHTPHAGSDYHASLLRSLLSGFQSTLPMRGATIHHHNTTIWNRHFNPHSPCGERHEQPLIITTSGGISIHTPHAGSDTPSPSKRCKLVLFQSTLPMRGATDSVYHEINGADISIHTPHAGSDADNAGFVSTEYNFNPHSPCGERHFTL